MHAALTVRSSYPTRETIVHLECGRLSDIDPGQIIALNTSPLVRRHMPLAGADFGEAECRDWVASKERQWQDHGYGPWAFVIDGRFAGWGGLQYEDGDADLALVLHPDYWGVGKTIYDEIIRRAFEEMGLPSITVLLPPSRARVRGILRLGFQPDGDALIRGQRFIRYRLHAAGKQPHTIRRFDSGAR